MKDAYEVGVQFSFFVTQKIVHVDSLLWQITFPAIFSIKELNANTSYRKSVVNNVGQPRLEKSFMVQKLQN